MPTIYNQQYLQNETDMYTSPTNAFTSSDVVSVFRFPSILNAPPIVFGELSTISYSFYRDKFPVRAVGFTRAKGYTRGARTVAGSLIFKLIDYSAINKFVNVLYDDVNNLSVMPDELPPFSVDITFANEYGENTKQSIISIEIVEGNQIITTDQLTISEQYSFVAQDVRQIDHQYNKLYNS